MAQTVMWAGATAHYGVRDHPERDVRETIVAGWL
jgi:hypothetical protein